MEHREITGTILEASFEVINELGAGFIESVYEKALTVALVQKGMEVQTQHRLNVQFRGVIVGEFCADMVVNKTVIVELKTVRAIAPDHKAQIINYLKATGITTGLLLNFGNPKLEYYRFYS